ncbi:Kelch repeat-containing protein [Deinococcus peraridilitoris]|uniref:Kelch motif protein n=1 Tax=Deinococcus peraridilitoris (strain DSM 19664 / LMG 22246 / CIP 109416 / KR-200) TaxID=937777 RepID=L0A326_DEIPD|nr:hypothetical protein [Deinococcus peraridilitoris]AFZ68241.1 hypothetical protein Deipe_2777 [Deinococcus peraridilitoris DSM 19664]
MITRARQSICLLLLTATLAACGNVSNNDSTTNTPGPGGNPPVGSNPPAGGNPPVGTPPSNDPKPTDPSVPVVDVFMRQSIAPLEKGTEEAQGETVGSRLYMFGGFDGHINYCCSPSPRARVFDAQTGKWSKLADMPIPQGSSSPNGGVTHAGITTDGKANIYYAGGYTSKNVGGDKPLQQTFGTKAVFQYSIASNSYTQLPDLPVPRAAGQLEYVNDTLHYFGGQALGKDPDSADHFVLDLKNLSKGWAKVSQLNQARNHLGAAQLNGKIYAIGGQTGHDSTTRTVATVEVYDPANPDKGWTLLTAMPYPASHIEATFVLGNRILVAGGTKGGGRTTEVTSILAFDPTKNSGMGTWVKLDAELGEPRAGGVAGAIDRGFVYVGGSGKPDAWLFKPVE